jgi:hypothetical protein
VLHSPAPSKRDKFFVLWAADVLQEKSRRHITEYHIPRSKWNVRKSINRQLLMIEKMAIEADYVQSSLLI